MNRSTELRLGILSKFDTMTTDDGPMSALSYLDVKIPIFDEVVNPNVLLPSVLRSKAVYIILQDQQTNMNETQTFCNPRFNLSMTIRTITKFNTTGSKKICEDIGKIILDTLRDDRGESKIDGISKIELITEQSIAEHTNTEIAFSNILILNFIKNG